MLILLERVNEAQRLAVRELKEMQAQDPRNNKKRKRSSDGDKDSHEGQESGGGSARDYHGSKERKTNSKGKSSRR